MDEALAYKWTAQALKPIKGRILAGHKYQQISDTIASAILEAYKLGCTQQAAMKIAKHKCQKCGHEWEGRPGPTKCPKCNHLYITWLNYKDFIKK